MTGGPALLNVERDLFVPVECPMCHAVAPSPGAIEAGDGWRCGRCGQRWDAARLATVASYAAWVEARGEPER